MKKIIVFCEAFILTAVMLAVSAPSASALQRIEDDNMAVTTKLAPQYLGYAVASGTSTTGTAYKYYKVSAVVPVVGETLASSVLREPLYDAGMTSTNSIHLMWAPVQDATSYKLYKSLDNSTFNLLTTTSKVTALDSGAAVGAAYVAPTPRGGNISAENDMTAGKVLYMGRATAIRGTIVPKQGGGIIYDATANEVCESTGSDKNSWVKQTSTTTACGH